MFRRIFGIGKRKNKNNPSTFDGSILLDDPLVTSAEDVNPSVVPMHSTARAIKKKKDAAEMFNDAVEKLVDKLEGINTNLDQQVRQNQQLVQQMDGLPEMLSAVPVAVEQQRQAFSNVADQLARKADHDEKMAEELVGIHEKVAASVEVDTQMSENFGKFSESLDRLDQDTVSQTEWLQQVSRTFMASERYMKYTLAKQQTRFYWILGISLGIFFFAIAGLLIGIVLLVNG